MNNNLKNINNNSKILKNETINLNPIFVIPEEQNYNIINFNSFFLYLFFILELIIIILILYYFFKKEIIFIYNNIFFNTSYTEEEKSIYNTRLYNIKKLFEAKKYCKLIPEIELNKTVHKNIYTPLFDQDSFMLALNNDIIYFNTEKECKNFLNI